MLSVLPLLFAALFAATSLAQSSTVCTQTACNQDNCYRNIQKSTAFCASFTAGPPVTTTAGLNPSQASCGPTRLSSACSCLYPSGATTESAKSSITQCTVISLVPSPTVFNYDFSNPTNPPVSVLNKYNLQSAGVVSDPPNAHSPPNVLKASFIQEQPGGFDSRNIGYYVTGPMRPFANYTFSFWAKQDAADSSFDYINLVVYGLKNAYDAAPSGPNGISNRLLHPSVSATWTQYSGKFPSGEYLYYYIVFYFNDGNPSQSGVIPALYVDDVQLVQS